MIQRKPTRIELKPQDKDEFIAKRRKEEKEKEAAIVPGGAKPSNVAQRIGYTGQRGRQEF